MRDAQLIALMAAILEAGDRANPATREPRTAAEYVTRAHALYEVTREYLLAGGWLDRRP
jgi:hypothetical protein